MSDSLFELNVNLDGSGEHGERFLGKYRGTVVQNVDPLAIGRIQAIVPDVSNVIPTSWAMPCVPWAGIQTGVFAVPPVGAGVWIEFEQGDQDYPIWSGCWWGSAAEVPVQATATPTPVPHLVVQTPGQNVLVVSDAPGPAGGIQLRSKAAMILINETGITISNGAGATIQMTGPTTTINAGALTVT
jgi:uncharacterized protein involved in type VI secretion and phage assembly